MVDIVILLVFLKLYDLITFNKRPNDVTTNHHKLNMQNLNQTCNRGIFYILMAYCIDAIMLCVYI